MFLQKLNVFCGEIKINFFKVYHMFVFAVIEDEK